MVYISCWVGGPDRPIAANARKSGNQIGKRWRWRAGCWRCTNRQNERKSLCVIPPLRTLIPPFFSTLHHCAAYCSRNVPQLSVAGGTATGVPLFILSSSSLSSSPPFLFIFSSLPFTPLFLRSRHRSHALHCPFARHHRNKGWHFSFSLAIAIALLNCNTQHYPVSQIPLVLTTSTLAGASSCSFTRVEGMGCSEVFESSQDERDLEVAGVVSGEEWKGVGGNQSTGRNKLSTAGSPLRLQHNNGT